MWQHASVGGTSRDDTNGSSRRLGPPLAHAARCITDITQAQLLLNEGISLSNPTTAQCTANLIQTKVNIIIFYYIFITVTNKFKTSYHFFIISLFFY